MMGMELIPPPDLPDEVKPFFRLAFYGRMALPWRVEDAAGVQWYAAFTHAAADCARNRYEGAGGSHLLTPDQWAAQRREDLIND
jgi:hypothetical protein